jgi:hypothetical protein
VNLDHLAYWLTPNIVNLEFVNLDHLANSKSSKFGFRESRLFG